MKAPKRIAGARNTVAVVAILATLIALGHDSVITWSLIVAVGAYLGLDLAFLHKYRSED